MLIVLRLCLCQCLLLLLLIPTNYQKRYKRIQIKSTTLHNNKRNIELLQVIIELLLVLMSHTSVDLFCLLFYLVLMLMSLVRAYQTH